MMNVALLKGNLHETPQIQFWRQNLMPFCRGIFHTNDSYLPFFAIEDIAEILAKQPENQEIILAGTFVPYPYQDEGGTECIQDYIRIFGINRKPDEMEMDRLLQKYTEADISPVEIYGYNLKLRQLLPSRMGA